MICSVTAIRLDKVEGTWAAVGWGDEIAEVVPPARVGLEMPGAIPASAAATETSSQLFIQVSYFRGGRL